MPDTSNPSKTIHRILLVDDHPIVRGGLARLISQQPELQVCGEAGTAAEARSLAGSLNPDLAIIDLRLRSGDGLELIKCLKAEMPGIRLLVLSQHSEQIYVERALRAGAMGYVVKDQPPEELLQAIRLILADQVYLSPGMAAQVLQGLVGGIARQVEPGVQQLSDRELGVLRLLGEGRSTREIATLLNLSFKTIESHRENIKRKLGLRTAVELVHFATRWAGAAVPSSNLQ